MDTRMGFKVKLNGPAALRQRLDRKKRAPINNRSLYKIEHSKLILSASPGGRGNAPRASSLPSRHLCLPGCALNSILIPYACLSLGPNRIALGIC
jgi:hypothetical protein